jgi:hypothetical protein
MFCMNRKGPPRNKLCFSRAADFGSDRGVGDERLAGGANRRSRNKGLTQKTKRKSTSYFLAAPKTLFVILLAIPSVARPEGEAAPAAGEKNKKEKPTAAVEFTQHESKINVIQSRIEDANVEFQKLVEEKSHEKDPQRLDGILKAMVDIANRRNKDVEEFNQVRLEILYKYPSKTAELNRLYEMEQRKTADEMQSTADLDEMLTRVKRVIDRKFASFNPNPPALKGKPDGKVETETEEPKRLKLEK